jgi:hypothetical protein
VASSDSTGQGGERRYALHADRGATERERCAARRAGTGERIEDDVAVEREHRDEPERELEREGTAPGPIGVVETLGHAPERPEIAEPDVPLFPEVGALRTALAILGGAQHAGRALAEQEHVLVLVRHVRTGGSMPEPMNLFGAFVGLRQTIAGSGSKPRRITVDVIRAELG